jgi:cytoskeletal protein CcmA (bactofilin family)
MWRKEDGRPQNPNEVPAGPGNPTAPSNFSSTPASAPIASKAVACVSQGIRIKGEVTGSEDLFIDGNLEGKVTLQNAVVTIGPNAIVKADLSGREVVIRGRVEGKLEATERIQIWHSARVDGDIRAERISIEEGAELHGKMEAGKAPTRTADSSPNKKSESSKAKGAEAPLEKATPGAAAAGAN